MLILKVFYSSIFKGYTTDVTSVGTGVGVYLELGARVRLPMQVNAASPA